LKYYLKFLPSLVLFTACVPTPGGGGQGGSSMITGLVPFILIFVLFYFLILRPQQKQNREKENMLKNLKRGDNILTTGGIYGKIVTITGDILTVEIARGLNIKVSRSGVAGIANPNNEEEKNAKEGKTDK